MKESERQRDALLPELRALKDDVRRVKELGLENKLRDSLVRVADAEYQQSVSASVLLTCGCRVAVVLMTCCYLPGMCAHGRRGPPRAGLHLSPTCCWRVSGVLTQH